MKLSPSFSNFVPVYAPRPTVPLEVDNLATSNQPKLVFPKHPQLNQPIEVSSLFEHSAQPQPSRPTISHPHIKSEPKKGEKSFFDLIPRTSTEISIPAPAEAAPTVEISIPAPKPIKIEPLPKIVSPLIPVKKATPIKLVPPKPKPQVPLFENSPIREIPLHTTSSEVEEHAEKPAPLNVVIIQPVEERPAETPKQIILESPKINEPQIQEPTLTSTEAPKLLSPELPADQMLLQAEQDLKAQASSLQKIIGDELEKINPNELTHAPVQPAPVKVVESPKEVPAIPAKIIEAPIISDHRIVTPAKSGVKTALKPSKPIAMYKPSFFNTLKLWDYFLIRVNPKINPYKSATRAKVVLGLKFGGLLFFVLGAAVVFANIKAFSINIVFESFSSLTIAGILLFLAENLNLFFEPVNPYKVHEVT